ARARARVSPSAAAPPPARRRGPAGARPPASLDAARDALTRADEATDTAERSLTNREFHRALYLPCGNPLLGRMLDEVRDQAALVSAVAWAADPSWEREASEHREILALALAGDADGAARALHAHIASFVRRAFPGAEIGAEGGPESQDIPEAPAARKEDGQA
ncbi:FCD domain-containing protein, partial [Streptomyces hirsutus]|uniref:FCD domain-containing protein n=1 Tax=Streptomyces hirsutus TaxID=35620 RepID=UPI00362E71DB